MPDIFVIGGPNGAGKSTAARELLPAFVGCVEFVNADAIALGLSALPTGDGRARGGPGNVEPAE